MFGKKSNKQNLSPSKGDERSEGGKPTAQISKLLHKEFRHNEADKLCEWVNENDIVLQTVAADGNRLYAFYWKPSPFEKEE